MLCVVSRLGTLIVPNIQQFVQIRQINTTLPKLSFFTRTDADDLWAKITGVSSAGKKKGRAKTIRKRIDLEIGQKFGIGKHGVKFPDLTKSNIDLRDLEDQNFGQKNQIKVVEREFTRTDLRRTSYTGKYKNPLNRGFSGNRMVGTSAGVICDENGEVLKEMKSVILMVRRFYTMTTLGRANWFKAIVAIGNCKGVAGYGSETGKSIREALHMARISATKNLFYFDLFENRTVFHDMDWRHGSARMTVFRKEAGYGLVCQRILAKLFYLVGVQDVYVKLLREYRNIESLLSAFFVGMLNMDTHQKLADDTGLMVVEVRPELMGFPLILASPSSSKDAKDNLRRVDIDKMKLEFKIPRIKAIMRPKKSIPVSELTHSRLSAYKRRNQMAASIDRFISEPDKTTSGTK